jgi:ketosteroid isomerase-like protein
MKIKLTISGTIFIFSALLFNACQNVQSGETETTGAIQLISADSLTRDWVDAWNQDNPVAIANMFNENSVLIYGAWQVNSRDSIMHKWVNKQMPQIANLQKTRISSGSGSDMAYYSGFWTLDITRNDSVIGQNERNFSAIWKKQTDQSWKIEMIHLGDTK